MAYSIEDKLVIGITSSALFDLKEANEIFITHGEKVYRDVQINNEDDPFNPGVAFEFIRKLLSLNSIYDEPFIEVILLSKNDPNTGLRVMNSIEYYDLNITRAIFLQGKPAYLYSRALKVDLFLSSDLQDVRSAIEHNVPAGFIKGKVEDIGKNIDIKDEELRIAFDFDGVIAGESSELFYQKEGLSKYQLHESENAEIPMEPGPLKPLLIKLSKMQNDEFDKNLKNINYKPRLRISIVTARNAPAHKRVIKTIRNWGIDSINEAFFLGGIEKRKVLEIINPHIFFDDQYLHIDPTKDIMPSVHIPFGRIKRIDKQGEG